eukprot:Rmarinus@m.24756
MGYLQTLWDGYRDEYADYSDAAFIIAAFSVVHGVVFWGLNIGLFIADQIPFFDRWRINPREYPDRSLLIRCLLDDIFKHVVAFPVTGYFAFLYFPDGIRVSGPIGSTSEVLLQLLGCMVVEDCLFYWTHRMFHHPLLYKHFHKKHHDFKITVGIASEYSHPVESFIGNLIPFLAGPAIFRIHGVTLMLWTVLRIWVTTDVHSGFAFPFSPWHMIPLIQGGSARHNFHHKHNIGSYGSFFTFWDWFCGTDRAFKAFLRKQAEKTKNS